MLKVIFLFVLLFCNLTGMLYAYQSAQSKVSTQDTERIATYKALIKDVDHKSLAQTITELEQTKYVHVTIAMREAMARTYTDIVKDQQVTGLKKKEWLYSMVNLNMAYLQFVGVKGSTKNTEPLNRLIRQKLREYLPVNITNQPGFHCSIE